jgi:hypothetical protein
LPNVQYRAPCRAMIATFLLRLPIELHLDIVDYLQLQDRAVLASTNRYFKSIVDPLSHEAFLAAEQHDWATTRGLYACKGCTRFRRFEEFADEMKKGKRVRCGPEAKARLCLDCGVAGKLYLSGTLLNICGNRCVLCSTCQTWNRAVGARNACSDCFPSLQRSYGHDDEYGSTSSHWTKYHSEHAEELDVLWRDA